MFLIYLLLAYKVWPFCFNYINISPRYLVVGSPFQKSRFIELVGLLKTFSKYKKVLIKGCFGRESSSMYFDKLSIMD